MFGMGVLSSWDTAFSSCTTLLSILNSLGLRDVAIEILHLHTSLQACRRTLSRMNVISAAAPGVCALIINIHYMVFAEMFCSDVLVRWCWCSELGYHLHSLWQAPFPPCSAWYVFGLVSYEDCSVGIKKFSGWCRKKTAVLELNTFNFRDFSLLTCAYLLNVFVKVKLMW